MTVPVSRVADARRYGDTHGVAEQAVEGLIEIARFGYFRPRTVDDHGTVLAAILLGEVVPAAERSVPVSDLQTAIGELLADDRHQGDFTGAYYSGVEAVAARLGLDLDRGETGS